MEYLLDAKEFFIARGADIVLTLIKAFLLLIIGWQVVKFLSKTFKNIILKKGVDPSLQVFLSSLIHNALIILLILTVLSTLGVEMTSFIAILGAAGLAIGLALQGSLSNFAGGILILLIKPFKVGDVIEAQNVIGSVSEIQIFHTVLKTYDNKTIIIPNGPLYNDVIINYTTEANRTVEWIFSVGYQDDLDKVKSIIKEVIFTDERVLNRDKPYIYVGALADNAVNLKVRALVENTLYWDVYQEKLEEMKKAFDQEGISIPFPQRDLHLYHMNKTLKD
jgi:small conductance mechanosensitive channel